MGTQEIARLLRAVADVIERNNSSEIRNITELIGRAAKRRAKNTEKGDRDIKIPDFSSITRRVLQSSDRATAKAVLEGESLTRRELTKLGQEHNVHIVKEDTVEVIETKIVEALVGSRLSSKAIRGEK